MQIAFHCPCCLKAEKVDKVSANAVLTCRHCGWTREPKISGEPAGSPTRCLVCGCDDLWRQKDFPPQIGLALVGLGIVASTVAVAYMRPILAMAILMGFALLDMLLFAVMRDRLVCYRCHAVYRGLDDLRDHAKFDLELHERYRQTAARLETVNVSPAKEDPSR